MSHLRRLLWPLALAAAWALGLLIAFAQVHWLWALLRAMGLALTQRRRWRQLAAVAGMLVLLATLHWNLRIEPWWALACGAALVLVYPVRAWRDAPLFPTGRSSLDPLRDGPWSRATRGLDLGSGLGDGLLALRAIAPAAHWTGVEMSWPLVWASQLRCPWARILRQDMWTLDWSEFDLVYSFQRPETMPRLWEKAVRELRPGSWVLSFQFAVPDRAPTWSAQNAQGEWLFGYQVER